MIRILTGDFNARRVALVLVEHVLIILSMVVAAVVRLGVPEPTTAASNIFWRAFIVAAVLQLALHYCDLYDLRTLGDRRDLFRGLLRALGAASFILAVLYYWIPALVIGRGVFALASVFILAVVVGWRVAFEWLSMRGAPAERLLIVGTNGAAVALARELFERRSELGVELVGFVDTDPTMVGSPMINPGVIGTIADIPKIVGDRRVDRVVVSLVEARGRLPMDQLLKMKLHQGVRFDHLASVYEQYTGKIAVENLRPSWMIFSEGFNKSKVSEAVKRTCDVILALSGLLLSAPLLLIVAPLVRLTSPGPALYSQVRVGKNGANFTIYKFRSMRMDAEAGTGAVWATTGDARVTRFGRFLRRSRLDELPQLWNVLIGNMSFVGPRPERPEFIEELSQQIPFYGQRHVVRPGLTGWAQVRHRYGSSVEDSLQKLQYDLFYIKHMSFAFDVLVVFETIKTVLVRVDRSGMNPIVNALTVDVEDYFQVSAFASRVQFAQWPAFESRVSRNTERLLAIFDRAGVRATFFVLGWVAERFPDLVRRIHDQGHELASHSYAHGLVYDTTPEAFREDLRHAKAAIEDASGVAVCGYRAPSYSIVEKSLWALDVLVSEGYSYDSSIYPIRHDRYGIPTWPRHIHRIERAEGGIWELPGSTVRGAGANLPVGGGGYFRLLPYAWTRRGLKTLNQVERRPAIFYLHPWEIDPDQPRIDVGLLSRLRHYYNLGETEKRLERLLREFRFSTVSEILEIHQRNQTV